MSCLPKAVASAVLLARIAAYSGDSAFLRTVSTTMSLMLPAWARSRTWSRKASNGSVYCMRNYINLFMHSAGVEPNLLVRALHASSYVPRVVAVFSSTNARPSSVGIRCKRTVFHGSPKGA